MDFEEWKRVEFERFQSVRSDQTAKLDNIIFVVGTGTFVLSINYIVGLKDNYLYLGFALIGSWVLLLTSVLCHALAYRVSIDYHGDMLRRLNSARLDSPLPVPDEKMHKKIKFLNDFSFAALVFGLVLLSVFAVYNFSARNLENLNHSTFSSQ